jgi:hypothetical protein
MKYRKKSIASENEFGSTAPVGSEMLTKLVVGLLRKTVSKWKLTMSGGLIPVAYSAPHGFDETPADDSNAMQAANGAPCGSRYSKITS